MEHCYGAVRESDYCGDVLTAGRFHNLTQEMPMPLMHAVEDADGDNSIFAGCGAGQYPLKAHSWLVPKAPFFIVV